MVRGPYFDKNGLKKGAWSKEEDEKLRTYIQRHGHWNWRQLPKFAGLQRCGKSCRIRWLNYLRPDVKRGGYSMEEEDLIIQLCEKLGTKWSKIAEHLPGRTDNEIKNYWHTHLKKRGNKQREITRPQEDRLEEQTMGSSQDEVIIQDVQKEENSNDSALKNNSPNSQPITILESSPFSPSTPSTASSSINAAFVGPQLDGDDIVISIKEQVWSEEEDEKLKAYIQRDGLVPTAWSDVPRLARLSRSSTSCQLRWMSHLGPEVVLKHGDRTIEEADAGIGQPEQLGQLRSTTNEETENRRDFFQSPEIVKNKEHLIGSPNLPGVPDLPDSVPDNNNFQLTLPEYSPSETSFFSSVLNMADATAAMDWINNVDASSNPFETFEADFWTQPFLLDLDTSATQHTYPMFSSNSISWEPSYIY